MCVFECRLQAIPPFAAKLTSVGRLRFVHLTPRIQLIKNIFCCFYLCLRIHQKDGLFVVLFITFRSN